MFKRSVMPFGWSVLEGKMKKIIGTLSIAIFATCAHAQDPDENLEAILEAARDLKFSSEYPLEGNRAYLLVKLITVRAPVALIFGYADNQAGCIEIAEDLNRVAADRGLDTALFDCDAVF